ncbi:MAG: CDP-diacylglycerol--glycerol-3-phosphate 3-phosphatidyltransferase [Stackebrandtia sp.]
MNAQGDAAEHSAPSVYNVANLLTVLRLFLVPVFVTCAVFAEDFTHTWWSLAASLVFIAASATDYVDGWLARRHGLVTAFGKVADPIADKVLTGAALVLLSVSDLLPWWVTGLVLLREWGITGLRVWVIRHGVIAASHGGKLKTVLQIVAISWYVWPLPEPFLFLGTWVESVAALGPWLMGAAVVATVVTGVDYVLRALVLRRRGRRGEATET